MGLESATYINGLVAANPVSGDPKSEGDDHLRLIKSTILATFPSITGPVTLTQTQINALTSGTSSGTYTPTCTAVANVSSTGAGGAFQWLRVGSVITVSGVVAVTNTAAANTLTQAAISLPVASVFTNSGQAGGVGQNSANANTTASINADIGGNRVILQNYATNSGVGNTYFCSFTYLVA